MLYTYNDPTRAFIDTLLAEAARFPVGTTVGTSFPTSALSAPHIQVAWDGTPTEEEQREKATMRVTYWAPKGQQTAAKDGASLARAVLLDGALGLWRVTKGAGRTPGVDDATGLPFCTFTLTAETKPSPVA